MIRGDRVSDVLHQHRLARFRRRDDQPALPFSDRRDDVDDAPGEVLFRLDVPLEPHVLGRVIGRQVLEENLVLRVLRRLAVDLVDFDEREIALPVFGRPDLAFDGVAGVQVEAANLRRRHVDVVGAGKIGRVRRAQETETVGQHFERAAAVDRLPLFGLILQERENELLLAHAIGAVDFIGDSHVDEFADVQIFQIG